MKKLEYISPSRLNLWKQSPDDFYLRYMALDKLEDDPQTMPMSVGSSFDAYVKSFLHEKLFGKGHDPRFDFQAIFEAQVEPHVRDFALEAGKHCFEVYKETGALSDLLLDLQKAVNVPRFEIEVKGVVNGYREGVTLDVGNITLLGKPDVFYINFGGCHVIIDFKVNGYCSKYRISPMPGYIRLRGDYKKSGQHKDCSLYMYHGTMINGGAYLEDYDVSWATQLAIYGWLCGAEVGEQFITGIHQLCCTPSGVIGVKRPTIRIAEHMLRIRSDFQYKTFADCQRLWELCFSDHFFRDMSKEDSLARCRLLDEQAAAMRGDGSEKDQWFDQMTRPR